MKQCPICCTDYTDEHTTCPTDNMRLMTSTEWTMGQVVANKYRVLAKIGRGGMGAVYKAMHISLEEIRALKVMDPQYARDPKFIARFRNEAQVARRLHHPNAVHVDDLDQADDGNLFIAMEFVDGVSLRHLISATHAPLPLARALWITHGVAEGLGAAHALGMVHRDIKPDNILLARDASGRDIPKVLDFGIVAMREGSAIVSSRPLLTPAYAPPEQWQGMKASELDGRADIYALGVTLYEMLAARSPFDATSSEGWLRAHLDQVPQPPSIFNPALQGNAEVDALVLRMLAKDRARRPADANTLIQELSLIEAQHTWGKGTIVSPLPLATPPPLPTSAHPLVPSVSPMDKEEEIPMPIASGARSRAQTDRSNQGSRKKIALVVGASLLVLAGIVFPVIRMMSKQPPEIISFDADPKTMEAGKPVRLSWDLTHVTKFRIEPHGGEFTAKADDVVVSGTTVMPRQDTTYILVASGPGGDKEARVSVSVVPGAPAARPATAAPAPPAASDHAPAGSSSRTVAAAQPDVSGDASVSPVAASLQVDACNGKPRCYSAGPFMAEVIGMTPSQTPPGYIGNHVLQVNVRFRNLTNQPLILAYVAGSGVITDNNGKRYDEQRQGFTSAAKGIGTVDRDKSDPQFVLSSGASSNASFVLARRHEANDPRDPIGATFHFDLSIAQLAVSASRQVSTLREYVVGFTDLGNSAGSGTVAAAQPHVSGDAPVSPVATAPLVDACRGKARCYSAGPFMAEVIGMTPSQTPPGYIGNHVLQVNVRFRNLTNQPLILAYVAGSGVITDNNGKRYDEQRQGFTNAAKGIGTVDRDKSDPQFVLSSGASSNASFVLARRHEANDPRDPIGATFHFDLSIAQLEVSASRQVSTLREYVVGFTDLGNSAGSRTVAVPHPDVSGDAPVSPVAASLRVGACNGKPHCYSVGSFMAEVTGMMPSQTLFGYTGNHVLQVNVRFRKLSRTNRPVCCPLPSAEVFAIAE